MKFRNDYKTSPINDMFNRIILGNSRIYIFVRPSTQMVTSHPITYTFFNTTDTHVYL